MLDARPQRVRPDAPAVKPQPALRNEVAQQRFLHGAGIDLQPGQQGAEVLRPEREAGAVVPLSGHCELRAARQHGGKALHPKPACFAEKRGLDPPRRPVAELRGAGIESEPQAGAGREAGKLGPPVPPAVEHKKSRGEAGIDRRGSPPVRPDRAGKALVRQHRIDIGELHPVSVEPDFGVETTAPSVRGVTARREPPGERESGRPVVRNRADCERFEIAAAE